MLGLQNEREWMNFFERVIQLSTFIDLNGVVRPFDQVA
jgi:hypothetical protein